MTTLTESEDAGIGGDTNYTLPLEGTIYGSISSPTDEDWYVIDYGDPLGYDYIVKASRDGTLAGLSSHTLTVYDERTNDLATEFGMGASKSVITLSRYTSDDKTGFIGIKGNGGAIGDYKIEVIREIAANEFTPASVDVNGRYDGVFDFKGSGFSDGDEDWISVDLAPGHGYFFRIVHRFELNTFGNVFDIVNSDGETVSTGDGDRWAYVAPDVRETVFVRAYNNQTKDTGGDLGYFVEVFRDVPGNIETRETLRPGQEKEGYFFPGYRVGDVADPDAYRVTLEAGKTYTASLRATQDFDNTRANSIHVLDEDGLEVARSFGEQEVSLDFVSETGGTFYVVASGLDADFDFEGSPDYVLSFGVQGEIYGSDASEGLAGTAGDDRIFGFSGDDTIAAANGDDSVSGGVGNDRLVGGRGNDTLAGARGNDQVLGGDGRDVLFGDNGADTLSGGRGADRISGGEDSDSLSGGDGTDVLNGGAGRDSLSGGKGADLLIGGRGADIFIFSGGSRDTVRDFTDGTDRISVRGMTEASAILAETRGERVLVTVDDVSFFLKGVSADAIGLDDFLL